MTTDWSKGKTRKQPFELFVMCKIAGGSGENHVIREDELLKQIMEEYQCSYEPAHRRLMKFLKKRPYKRYYQLAWRGVGRHKVVCTLLNPREVIEDTLNKYRASKPY